MFPLRAIINASAWRSASHPNVADAHRRAHQRAPPAWALAHRPLRAGRRHHDRRQHLRLHRRQGRAHHRQAVGVRRLLGLDARPLLGPRAVHRPDLALLDARPQRLRAHHDADADLLDHDQLRARPRRVADREVQGRLHGAARAHRAVHDRRLHRPDGRRAVGDPGAVDRDGGQPDLLHVSGAQPAADAVARRARRVVLRVRSSGATSGRRSPTTSG